LTAHIPDFQVTLAAEIVQHVRQHRDIVSPVRRIPMELVWEIFAILQSDGEAIVQKFPWSVVGHKSWSWRNRTLLWLFAVIVTECRVWLGTGISTISQSRTKNSALRPALIGHSAS
jgi:hypothetical protein